MQSKPAGLLGTETGGSASTSLAETGATPPTPICSPTYTHLLPHDALPVPGAEVG
jgi:hypothetical protein